MKIIEILKETFENLDSLIPNIRNFDDLWYFTNLPNTYLTDEEELDGMPTVIQYIYNIDHYQQWFSLSSQDVFTGVTIFVPDNNDYQRYYYNLSSVLDLRLKVYSNVSSEPVPLPITDDTYFNFSMQQEMKLTHEEMIEIEKYFNKYQKVIDKYKLNIEIVMKRQ
ncbi:hypothetical protein XaC1_105 [Xanthomonas phage XaC1]|nr:hypothetical protein XaC1_105 [Xanthomonas phage XaC1]